MKRRTVAAGAFKQGCLAMLEEVAARKVEIVVTKRGRPVARVIAANEPSRDESEVMERLRARTSGRRVARDRDLLRPSGEWVTWDALRATRKK
jgi:prevent-host-death family protein